MEKTWVIVNASRFQESALATTLWQGKPLYFHCLQKFAHSPKIDGLILLLDANKEYLACDSLGVPVRALNAGENFPSTIQNIVQTLPSKVTHLLWHDAAYPFFSLSLVAKILCTLALNPLVLPVENLTDTFCIEKNQAFAMPTVRIQMPIGIEKARLKSLLCENCDTFKTLLLKNTLPIATVPGDRTNTLLAQKEDLPKTMTPKLSIGYGYDVHKYGGTRPFILGGVRIPTDITLDAHSDGDVLLHAVMDALLGACGLGDIGEHFPPADPRFDGISSGILLQHVLTQLTAHAQTVLHIDVTIVAQKPKIAPFKEQIRNSLASSLMLEKESVNIKATTEEHLGFTGRCEGIKVSAVALCQKNTFDS